MEFNFVKGTRFPLGRVFVELPSDQTLNVIGVESFDHLAEVLAAANHDQPGIFGKHSDELTHDETVTRKIDGADMEVDLEVTYGVGGARVETVKSEPRTPTPKPAVSAAPAPQPDEFPPSFPGYTTLVAAGITKRSQLRGKTIEELERIKGVQPEIARRIFAQVAAEPAEVESAATEEHAPLPDEPPIEESAAAEASSPSETNEP